MLNLKQANVLALDELLLPQNSFFHQNAERSGLSAVAIARIPALTQYNKAPTVNLHHQGQKVAYWTYNQSAPGCRSSCQRGHSDLTPKKWTGKLSCHWVI